MKNYTIKEIIKNERPMEKLATYGRQSLSNSELLAILIGSGTKKKNAIKLADEILHKKLISKNLLYTEIQQLVEIDGIGLSKASRIIAGLELGKRLSKIDKMESISLTNPDSVADYLFEHFRDSYKEEFVVLLLNTKNRIITTKTISQGTINQTLVHPREVFRDAILHNANAIIVSHNHPSGDPTPSNEDILITDRLVKVGEYIGIKVLDHIVVGNNEYISFREKGLIKEKI
nr:DNA repair protein RadC [Helcococcus sueciensis]